MKTTEPCGCTHNGHAWLSKCELCALEDRRIAARWAAEHVRTSHATMFTKEFMALAREHDPSLLNPMDQSDTQNDTAWLNTVPEQGALL